MPPRDQLYKGQAEHPSLTGPKICYSTQIAYFVMLVLRRVGRYQVR